MHVGVGLIPELPRQKPAVGLGELDGLFDHAHTAFGRWRDHHVTLNVSAVVTTSG